MGLAGIILFIASFAIAIFIIIDTYLGTPPKPKTLGGAIITVLIGISLIYGDYNLKPRVAKVELVTDDIEIIENVDKDEPKQINKPYKIIVTKDEYPWYSLFNKDRIRIKVFEKDEEKSL